MMELIRECGHILSKADRLRILERTNEGRLEAKSIGIKFGRKPTVHIKKVLLLHEQGIGAVDIDNDLKIGRSTVYQVLKLYKESPIHH